MYYNTKDYYNVAGVSAEDVIDGLNMLHREGAALKYLFRCNNILVKGDIKEDLKKCRHYLSRCLLHKNIIRDYSASYWIENINPNVFSDNIYNAIVNIIEAAASPGPYEKYIKEALENVTSELSRY